MKHNQNMNSNRPLKVEFNFPDIFKTECPLTRFVIVLIQIHSNITHCHNRIANQPGTPELDSDSYIYYFGNLLSHNKEAVKAFNSWKSIPEVMEFLDKYDLRTAFENVSKMFKSESEEAILLKDIRDRLFHYNTPRDGKELDEVIQAVTAVNSVAVAELDSNSLHYLKSNFSKDVISALITIGHDNQVAFQEKMYATIPILSDVRFACSEIISTFLYDRGAVNFVSEYNSVGIPLPLLLPKK